ELLIARGADVNARDTTGATALEQAAWKGEESMIRLLISKGADPKCANPNSGVTPLHAAASRGYKIVADVLLDAGASATARDKLGATPLDDALQARQM